MLRTSHKHIMNYYVKNYNMFMLIIMFVLVFFIKLCLNIFVQKHTRIKGKAGAYLFW